MLTTKEVARKYGVSVSTVGLWVKDGAPVAGTTQNRSTRIPSRVFDMKKLQAWLDKEYGKPYKGGGRNG